MVAPARADSCGQPIDPVASRAMHRYGMSLTIAVAGATLGVAACQRSNANAAPGSRFEIVEATIPQMREAMEQGRLTSRDLVRMYLTRLGMYQQKLRAAVYVNANALSDAEERDRERAQRRVRGPLHGIPIALKDNIHTTNLPTSGGALAFDGFVPPYEATLTKNLVSPRIGGVVVRPVVVDRPVRELEVAVAAGGVDVEEIGHSQLADTDLDAPGGEVRCQRERVGRRVHDIAADRNGCMHHRARDVRRRAQRRVSNDIQVRESGEPEGIAEPSATGALDVEEQLCVGR